MYVIILLNYMFMVFLILRIYDIFRPGASSGTLLGAVTLPGLMLSRLIQSLRAVSLDEVGVEGREFFE